MDYTTPASPNYNEGPDTTLTNYAHLQLGTPSNGTADADYFGTSDNFGSDFFVMDVSGFDPSKFIFVRVITPPATAALSIEWRVVNSSYLDSFGPLGLNGVYIQSQDGTSAKAFALPAGAAGYVAFQVINNSTTVGSYHVQVYQQTTGGYTNNPDITSDRTGNRKPGHEVDHDDSTVTVHPGVHVSSLRNDAISSVYDRTVVINDGFVKSYAFNTVNFFFGTYLQGNDAQVTNNAGGVIAGKDSGIGAYGRGVTIINHGLVKGSNGYGVLAGEDAKDVSIDNDGTIYGKAAGVLLRIDFDTGPVTTNNAGTIWSKHYGMMVIINNAFDNTDFRSVMVNEASGVIKGPDAAILTRKDGVISLTNEGTIDGKILLKAANQDDFIENTGQIKGSVHLGSGNDTFDGQGGTSGTVFGEGGNDILIAGPGKDKFVGGKGADQFVFKSAADTPIGVSHDIINDFSHAQGDKIDLSAIDANSNLDGDQEFSFIGKQAFSQSGELRFANHLLQGDVNGDGIADFEIVLANTAIPIAGPTGDFVL